MAFTQKVISMPCQELFDQQSEVYKNKILNETKLVISIEASETGYWKNILATKDLILELIILEKVRLIKIYIITLD